MEQRKQKKNWRKNTEDGKSLSSKLKPFKQSKDPPIQQSN